MALRKSFSGNLFGGLLFGGGLFGDTSSPPPPPPPPVDISATNCLIGRLVMTRFLVGSLPHARECEGDAVALSAIRQSVNEPKYEKPRWSVTIPAAELPVGGLVGWTLPVANIARGLGDVPILTVPGTVSVNGDPGTPTDAVLTFDWDTLDPAFSVIPETGYEDDYRYSVFVTDGSGKQHLVAQGILSALPVVHA
jgi:hypothetical protein